MVSMVFIGEGGGADWSVRPRCVCWCCKTVPEFSVALLERGKGSRRLPILG